MANAIERFFTEPGLRYRLSSRARVRAEAMFDARTIVTNTVALYDELVGVAPALARVAD